jgi:hypothetical protein
MGIAGLANGFSYQGEDFVVKLSLLERFLIGESYDDVEEFQPNVGANPLQDWCKDHVVPIVRHSGPGNTVTDVF